MLLQKMYPHLYSQYASYKNPHKSNLVLDLGYCASPSHCCEGLYHVVGKPRLVPKGERRCRERITLQNRIEIRREGSTTLGFLHHECRGKYSRYIFLDQLDGRNSRRSAHYQTPLLEPCQESSKQHSIAAWVEEDVNFKHSYREYHFGKE